MNRCPRCGEMERQNKAGKTAAGNQRYRCMKCGRTYTLTPATKLSTPLHDENSPLKTHIKNVIKLKISIRRKQVIRWAKIILLALIIIWVVSAGILSGALLIRAVRLRQMTTNLKHINLTALAPEVHGARREATILRGELEPLLWIGARFGGDLGAVQPLMDAGIESLKAADEVITALTPSLGKLELAAFSMKQVPQILDAIASAHPFLVDASTHIGVAATEIKRIKGPLSPRMENWVSKASQLVQLAQFGMGGAQIAPEFLGQAGSRTYLILLQNSMELRPTGGFISAVGHVQINQGQLSSIKVEDSYSIDDFTKVYPDPPQPLLDYMGSEQWVLRDANWSPDFPTTALDAIRLYQISRPEQVDGVIGLDLKGVSMLIAGVEPLEVQGLSEPVTSANVIGILQEGWNPPRNIARSEDADWWSWFLNRKKTINMIMQSAMDKLLAGEVNWKQLGLGMIDALNQRQLMVFTIQEANELEKLNWNGALHTSAGDYLMVVDANVGFNKVNPLIQESVVYNVNLLPDGTGRAVVDLNYVNQSNTRDGICSQVIPYYDNVTYVDMMQACYYDYLRLIVPHGSKLEKATVHPVPGKYLISETPADGKAVLLQDSLKDWTMFGQFFVVEYGKQLLTRFEYNLPVVVTDIVGQKHYSLLIQKQPGTDAIQVKVKLTLPAKARLVSSNMNPVTKKSNTLEFDLKLDVDQQLEITYKSAP